MSYVEGNIRPSYKHDFPALYGYYHMYLTRTDGRTRRMGPKEFTWGTSERLRMRSISSLFVLALWGVAWHEIAITLSLQRSCSSR